MGLLKRESEHVTEHENDRKKEPKKCLDATQEAPTLLGAGGNYLDSGANLDLWQTEKKTLRRVKLTWLLSFCLPHKCLNLDSTQENLWPYPREWQPTVTHVKGKQEQLSVERAILLCHARHYFVKTDLEILVCDLPTEYGPNG